LAIPSLSDAVFNNLKNVSFNEHKSLEFVATELHKDLPEASCQPTSHQPPTRSGGSQLQATQQTLRLRTLGRQPKTLRRDPTAETQIGEISSHSESLK
jgi:hypothetical protein